MSRKEFTRQTRRDAWARCGKRCEGILQSGERCDAVLTVGKYEFDHVIPDEIGGSAELSNCQVLCLVCHGVKTGKIDIPMITRAKRVSDRHLGIRKRSTFPCSRDSKWKKTINGKVVRR